MLPPYAQQTALEEEHLKGTEPMTTCYILCMERHQRPLRISLAEARKKRISQLPRAVMWFTVSHILRSTGCRPVRQNFTSEHAQLHYTDPAVRRYIQRGLTGACDNEHGTQCP